MCNADARRWEKNPDKDTNENSSKALPTITAQNKHSTFLFIQKIISPIHIIILCARDKVLATTSLNTHPPIRRGNGKLLDSKSLYKIITNKCKFND